MKSSASLRDFLVILFKYKYRISIVLTVTLATVIIGVMLWPPVYEASSTLLVKFGREYIYLDIGESGTPYNYFNREGIINAEIEIFISRDLQEKCIKTIGIENLYPDLLEISSEDLSPQELALRKFGENLSAQGNKNTSIIYVSFRHSDPKIAAESLNLLVELFKEKHLETFSDPKTSAFLVEKMTGYQTLLNKSGKKIESFKKKYAAFSLKEQQRLLLEQRSDLDLARKTNQSQITELKEKLASLESQMKAKSGSSTLYSDTELKRKSEIYKGIEDTIIQSKAELSSQKAKTAVILRQLKEIEKTLQTLINQEKELQNLEREFAINEQNYLTYEGKVEEARILDEMSRLKMTNIKVVQEAVAPTTPVLPRKGLSIAIGFFLGLFGGLGLAVVQEYLNQGFNTRESIEKRLGLPVLNAIAYKELQK